MKLRPFDRFLLALLLLIGIVFSFVLFGMASRLIPLYVVQDFISLFYGHINNSLILAGCGLVLLFICLKIVFSRKDKKPQQPPTTLVRQGEIGGTYIALSAIDAMVQKHCRQQAKVRDCSSTLRTTDAGVCVNLKLSVLPDTDIVALTADLQKSLKEYIESLAGVNVPEVSILVESASASAQHPAASRVE